jgi:hypothetical protein
MMTNRKLHRKFLLLFCFAALACRGEGDLRSQEGRLLPPDTELTAEQKRLREMQYAIVVSAEPDDGAQEVWDLSRPEAVEFLYTLLGNTKPVSFCDDKEDAAPDSGSCVYRACVLGQWLEAAARILTVSQGFSVNPGRSPTITPTNLHSISDALRVGGASTFDPDIYSVKFPPQSTATRVWMANLAAEYYRRTILSAREYLDGALDGDTPLDCTPGGYAKLAEESASGLRQALIGLERATEEAGRLTVAVADQQLGSSTQASIATARGFAGEELSRAAAAHLYVGGVSGIQGNTSRALCSSFELTAETQEAVDIIRQLAPPPSEILTLADGFDGEIEFGALDTFLNGTSETGSLRERYEAFHSPVTIDSMESKFKLRSSDFGAAIRYLAQELRAYSRASDLPMATTDPMPIYERFAAVATPPGEQPDAYWAALTRTETPLDGSSSASVRYPFGYEWQPVFSEGMPTTPPTTWFPKALSEELALVAEWASDRMSTTDESAQTVLRNLVGASEALGVFEHRAMDDNDQFSVQLFRADNVTYYVALGDDAMRCAVQGKLEGEECDPWAVFGGSAPTALEMTAAPALVDDGYSVAAITAPVVAGSRRVYLMRARPGWVPTATELQPGAGDFQALLGIAAHRPFAYSEAPADYLRRYGIVPKAEERAAEFMKLSQLDCSRPQLSCASGSENSNLGRFDERLPLENELADDKDGVESSWKYYLTQARAASNESDALAREYIEASLGADQRAEAVQQREADLRRAQEEKAAAALDRVQQICGTSADIPSILGILANFGDLGPQEACDPETDSHPIWTCMNGRWVKRIDQISEETDSPELLKLLSCVHALQEPTNLQLSRSTLCYWTDDKGEICQGPSPDGGTECPAVAIESSCPSGYEPIGIEDSLQLFDISQANDSGPKEPVDAAICGDIRYLRRVAALGGIQMEHGALPEGSDDEAINRIGASGLFDVPRLNDVRSGLSVQATYGGYVSALLGGAKWLSTGSATSGGNVGTWPCADSGGVVPSAPADCGENGGFRCSAEDCTNPTTRAEMNDRLLDGFLALELMTQTEVDVGNRGIEPHLEFWLPVRLFGSLYPEDYYRTTKSFHSASPQGSAVAYEWGNSRWRLYTPNGAFPPGASTMFTRRGIEIPFSGLYGDYGFQSAFARSDRGAAHTGSTRDAFVGGFGREGEVNIVSFSEKKVENGYFYSRVKGTAHKQALEQLFEKTYPWGAKGDELYSMHLLPNYLWADNDLCPSESMKAYQLQHGVGKYPDPDTCVLFSPVGEDLDFYANEGAMWDALELLCEAESTSSSAIAIDCNAPPAIGSESDFTRVAGYLDCMASKVSNRAARTILQGMPTRVVESIRQVGVEGVRGEIGIQHSQVREAIRSLATSGAEFARIMRGFAVELRQIKSRLTINELEAQLASLQFESTVAQQITNCATAIAEASGWLKNVATFGSQWAGVAATCVNTGIQTGIAARIRDISKEIKEEERDIILGDSETQFLLLEHAVSAEAQEVNSVLESLQRSLGQIESLRSEANRKLNDAIWYLAYEDPHNQVIDRTMNAQALTAQVRYQQAHRNAQRWSFLARRAIEQRLGVELNTLRDDLPLVEAPQKWIDSVCATDPINYEALDEDKGYADAFIGDYVTKLENVVESYRQQFGFQEGRDVAVVSLRDDVMNVKQECEVPSRNRLFHTGRFAEAGPAMESAEDVWQIAGCDAPTGEPGAGYAASCLQSTQVDSPFVLPGRVGGTTNGYELTFSDGTGNCSRNPEQTDIDGVVTGGCSWTEETRLSQKRALVPGLYRFSWYSPPAFGGGAGLGKYAGAVWDGEGDELVSRLSVQEIPSTEDTAWDRYFLEFDLDEPMVVEFGFARGDEGAIPAWEDNWIVSVGAPMLDAVETTVAEEFRGPRPFENTGATLTVMSPDCEDTDGDVFRTHWRRKCERVCPEGFGGLCPEDVLEQCYREASFFISQRSIASGKSLVQSGFARGNFNYRFDSVGVNFVGTGTRDCETSDTPSTCFSGGFVPYSLYHKGPYFVHNHYGNDYRAHLFEGVIEHARGLAAERYLSNPIASTDRELLEDYLRTEYQGRPLDGHFVLRVWEEPGVNFDALEDAQLILNYRYWSR